MIASDDTAALEASLSMQPIPMQSLNDGHSALEITTTAPAASANSNDSSSTFSSQLPASASSTALAVAVSASNLDEIKSSPLVLPPLSPSIRPRAGSNASNSGNNPSQAASSLSSDKLNIQSSASNSSLGNSPMQPVRQLSLRSLSNLGAISNSQQHLNLQLQLPQLSPSARRFAARIFHAALISARPSLNSDAISLQSSAIVSRSSLFVNHSLVSLVSCCILSTL